MNLPVSGVRNDSQCGSYAPKWYLIRTKGAQESRAAYNLEQIGAQVLYPRDARKPDRGFFPGYVFASFRPELFRKASNAFGVRKLVRFGSEPAEVPNDVVVELRRRMNPAGLVQIPVVAFRRGDRVTVKSGPLRSFDGIFDCELSSKDRVQILLSTLLDIDSRMTRVEVSANDLVLSV